MDYCTILYDMDCESIVPSIVWLETRENRFEDLSSTLFSKAIRFVQEHFFETNNILKGLRINEDQEAVAEICSRLQFIMNDEASMVVFDKNIKQIAGLMISKVMDYEDYSWIHWKMKSPEHPIVKRFYALQYDMHFACDLQKKVENSPCFHIFYLITHGKSATEENYFRRQLLMLALKVGRKLKCEYLTYLATSRVEQLCADKFGMMVSV